MKKILIISLVAALSSSLLAQVNVDSVLSEGKFIHPDSIKISELVKQQIEEAKLKALQEEEIRKAGQYEAKIIPIALTVPGKSIKNTSSNFLNSISTEVKVLIAVSFLLLLLVLFRRVLIHFKKNVKNQLKKRIALLREENIIVKRDRKKTRVRKFLAKDKLLTGMSEKNMTRKAKEMEISKGELMLAARLKFLEYGKM